MSLTIVLLVCLGLLVCGCQATAIHFLCKNGVFKWAYILCGVFQFCIFKISQMFKDSWLRFYHVRKSFHLRVCCAILSPAAGLDTPWYVLLSCYSCHNTQTSYSSLTSSRRLMAPQTVLLSFAVPCHLGEFVGVVCWHKTQGASLWPVLYVQYITVNNVMGISLSTHVMPPDSQQLGGCHGR